MSSIRLLRHFLPTHPPGSADDRRRDPIQAGFLLLASVLAGAMFLFRLLDAGWVAATVISLLACLAYIALQIAFQRNLDRALVADCSLLVLLIVILAVASRDNGLYSRVMIWLPAAPLISNFFSGRIRAIGSCVLVILLLLGLALAHRQGHIASYPGLGSEWARFIAYSASTILVAATAYLYEQNRREADAEKERLAALHRQWVSVVSHELRTPLTALHGALALASRDSANPAQQRDLPFFAIALRNTERLVRLVDELLDMERINSDRLTLMRCPSSVTQLLESARNMYQQLASERHITVAVQSNVSDAVNIDADRIEQVLHNLLSNAIKFSKTGSTVQLFAELRRGGLHVEVRDAGPGIDKELAARLFTPFSQGDGADNRSHGGFGLGLSICKAIVVAHGGQISYRNEVAGGCTFYFDIPVDTEQSVDDAHSSHVASPIDNNTR